MAYGSELASLASLLEIGASGGSCAVRKPVLQWRNLFHESIRTIVLDSDSRGAISREVLNGRIFIDFQHFWFLKILSNPLLGAAARKVSSKALPSFGA